MGTTVTHAARIGFKDLVADFAMNNNIFPQHMIELLRAEAARLEEDLKQRPFPKL